MPTPTQRTQPKTAGPQPGLGERIKKNIDMAKKGYEQLVHAVIRPPRAKYHINQLGPSQFTFLKQRFRREDVQLLTNNTTHPTEEGETPTRLKMQASVWTRDGYTDHTNNNGANTMVVYLHGNASARVEVVPSLSFLLAQGVFGVCSLDFTGSGQSDGEYVSLGYYERYDLECALQYLKLTYGPNLEIVLWGRSMGASTALMHASQKTQRGINSIDNNSNTYNTDSSTIILKGLICDSPFASLTLLCEELVEKARSKGMAVPGVIVGAAIHLIARSVRKHAHFDIREITPLEHAPSIDVPCLFVCGEKDDFIPPQHSETLIEAYKQGVSTNLFMVPGQGHNDVRPPLVFEAAAQFLNQRLSLKDTTRLYVPPNLAQILHKNPPWAYSRNTGIFQAHDYGPPAPQRNSSMNNNSGGGVAAAVAVPSEELGMTQALQDDIQNKIGTMLGGGVQK